MLTFIKILIGAVVFSLLATYSIFSYGVVTLNFWNWFIVPVFPSTSSLSFWQAIGLSLVLVLMKGYQFNVASYIRPEYLKRDSMTRGIIIALLFPWILFLIGFILK